MLAREATNTDIEEMKRRLRKKREDSIIERSMDDAIGIVRKRSPDCYSVHKEVRECINKVDDMTGLHSVSLRCMLEH